MVLFLIACTGLWLSVPFEKKKIIRTCINKEMAQEKNKQHNNIIIKLCLAEPRTLEMPSSVASAQVWYLGYS